MRKISLLLVFLAVTLFLASCGGGSTTPVSPSSLPISVEYLDGAADVALDSTFKATFSQAIDTATVTNDTFFIVETGTAADLALPFSASLALPVTKAAYNATTCSGTKIPADVSCASNTECTLDPSVDLANATEYTLCLTTGIKLADGVTSYAGSQATFTTAAVTFTAIDAWGRNFDGNLAANSTAIRIMFSEDMDITTVTDPNVNLTCGTAQLITVTQAPTPTPSLIGSLRTFNVTPADANSLQLASCTLGVTADVKTLAGAAVTPASITGTVGCALNGPFGTAAQACWTVYSGGTETWDSWLGLNNVITYPVSGELFYSTATQVAATLGQIYKTVTVPVTGFTMTLNLKDPAAFTSTTNDYVGLFVRNNSTENIILSIGVTGNDLGGMVVEADFNDTTTGRRSRYWTAALTTPATYRIQMSIDTTNGIQASCLKDGADLPLVLNFGVAFPNGAQVSAHAGLAGDGWQLGQTFQCLPATCSATVQSISTPGLTSTTQY